MGFRSEPDEEERGSRGKLVIPFSPTLGVQKGITREPMGDGRIDAVTREKLLNAIRRSCRWVEAVRSEGSDPIPHPDDIIIDMRADSIINNGPMSSA